MTNLIVLAGVPGSGKSTWAKQYFDLKYSIVSSDAIRKEFSKTLKDAHQQGVKPWDEFYKRIYERLTHSVDTVADATFLTTRHREKVLKLAADTGAKPHLVLFKNVLQASTRNARRDEDARVPENVMGDMMRLYWDTLARIPQEPWESVLKVESYG